MAGNPEFGRRIRELREARKETDPEFSLRRFAVAVGISATFMSKVENGEFDPPAVDKIKRMAALLDIDPDELLALAGKVDPELPEIIREQPKAMADFLRTAREMGLGSSDINALTSMIRAYGPAKRDSGEKP
ncbi:MAG: helix-turn-helix domain-containing protein [Magnetococcales bacterium]|nr:helix-turn-helix domain-containing protein [Magnetococcales bacterium]